MSFSSRCRRRPNHGACLSISTSRSKMTIYTIPTHYEIGRSTKGGAYSRLAGLRTSGAYSSFVQGV